MNNELCVGDWRLFKYSCQYSEFYVLQIVDDMVKVGMKEWLVSSSIWLKKDEFIQKSMLIDRGRLRWWWRFLPIVNNLICPVSKCYEPDFVYRDYRDYPIAVPKGLNKTK